MTTLGRFVLVSTVTLLGSATAQLAADVSTDPVKLTGCLIQSDDNDGFLLINAPMEPGATTSNRGTVTPGTVGTSPMFANIFYWLDKDDDLKPHVGHRVEIEGEIKGDVKAGELKIDRKDAWTEIEIKADGRDMKARVPNASVVAGPNADRKLDVLVRRLDPEKIKMLDASCR